MKRGAGVLRGLVSSWGLLATVTLTQLAQVPIALAALTDEEFGLFAVLSQLVTSLMLMELGVSFAFGRLLIDGHVEGEKRMNAIWSSGMCLFCMQAGLILFAMVAVTPFIPQIFSLPVSMHTQARALFLSLGVVMVIGYPFTIFRLALFAGQRLATSNVVQLPSVILQFGVFVMGIRLHWGLWAYIASMAVAVVFGAVVYPLVCRRSLLGGRFSWASIERSEMRTIFVLGLDVFVSGVFSIFMGSSLLLFAGIILPLQQVAMLSVNLKVYQMLLQVVQRVPSSAEPALMELVSQKDLDRFRFGWSFLTKVSLGATLLCAGGLYLFGQKFVAWWASPKMVLGPGSVCLIGLMAFRYMLHHSLVGTLVMFKEIRRARLGLFVEAGVYTILVSIWGPKYGIIGLLTAHGLSFFGGAVWPGVKRVAEDSGFTRAAIWGVVVRSSTLPLMGCLGMVFLVPSPGGRSWVSLIAIAAGWTLCNVAHLLLVSLDESETLYLRQSLQRLLRRPVAPMEPTP